MDQRYSRDNDFQVSFSATILLAMRALTISSAMCDIVVTSLSIASVLIEIA